MKKLNLSKYGFLRSKAEDFNFNGAKQSVYYFGPLQIGVIKCKSKYRFVVSDPFEIIGIAKESFDKIFNSYRKVCKYNEIGIDIDFTEQDIINFRTDCINYVLTYLNAVAGSENDPFWHDTFLKFIEKFN